VYVYAQSSTINSYQNRNFIYQKQINEMIVQFSKCDF